MTRKSHQSINRSSWNFPHISTWLSSTCNINFSSISWAVGILWIAQFRKKSTFYPTSVAHISRWRSDRKLKLWTQVHLDATELPYEFQLSIIKRSCSATEIKTSFSSQNRLLITIFSQNVTFLGQLSLQWWRPVIGLQHSMRRNLGRSSAVV